jgi:hypothetical protein
MVIVGAVDVSGQRACKRMSTVGKMALIGDKFITARDLWYCMAAIIIHL